MNDQERDSLFKEHLDELNVIIAKRRSKWRATSVMEWEEVANHLLLRAYRQLHRYDAARPLDRWVNKLISNEIRNLLRNTLYKSARPCVAATSYGSACAFNTGGDGCSWTKSRIQCSECTFFRAWEKKKQSKFAIETPLSIEDHIDSRSSSQGDFADRDEAKKLIDDNIKRRLTKEEYRIYVYLYIKHLDRDEVVKRMKFAKRDEKDMKGYMRVRSAAIKCEEVARQILSESGFFR